MYEYEDTIIDTPEEAPAPRQRKKRPGRPKGSRSASTDLVTADDARCIKCASTKLRTVKKTRELDHAGVTPGGERYTGVVYRRKQCEDCGQMQVVKSFTFDPAKWRG